jgi:hypothetical protein
MTLRASYNDMARRLPLMETFKRVVLSRWTGPFAGTTSGS